MKLYPGLGPRMGGARVLALAALSALTMAVAPAVATTDVTGQAVSGTAVRAMPVNAVPLEEAGRVVVWGQDDVGQLTLPPELEGRAVSQVAVGYGVIVALTSEGKVVAWGGNSQRLQRVPETVAAQQVKHVAIFANSYAGAVTTEGKVLMWGPKPAEIASPLDVPTGLLGVQQLAISKGNGIALKADGTVVAWGRSETGINDVPEGLVASAVTADTHTAFALTVDGTVVGWGESLNGELELPPEVQVPGNVEAVAALGGGALALLADGSLIGWGARTLRPTGTPPTVLQAVGAAIGGRSNRLAVFDTSGTLRVWRSGSTTESGEVPSSLQGAPVAQFGIGDVNGAAIVTAMLVASPPAIPATALVGSTVSATPAEFSGSPDAVDGQWLLDGVEIAGQSSPTLVVLSEYAGRQLSYRSTAYKIGEVPASSDSVGVLVAKAPLVASSTKITKASATRGGKVLSVAAKISATKSPQGSARITVKKGKTTIISRVVGVSRAGATGMNVKRFSALVKKRTGVKSATAYRGKYIIAVEYRGNSQVRASKAIRKLTVRR